MAAQANLPRIAVCTAALFAARLLDWDVSAAELRPLKANILAIAMLERLQEERNEEEREKR